jgi:hypothetical protein
MNADKTIILLVALHVSTTVAYGQRQRSRDLHQQQHLHNGITMGHRPCQIAYLMTEEFFLAKTAVIPIYVKWAQVQANGCLWLRRLGSPTTRQ